MSLVSGKIKNVFRKLIYTNETSAPFTPKITASNNSEVAVTSLSCDITGNAATATKLATQRTINIDGVVDSGAVQFDGSGNITLTTTIDTNLALPGSPTTTTQSASDNSTKIATTAYVETAVSNLVDSAPDALNTLNELAAALGDDANYATTTTNALAAKAPIASPTFTGTVAIPNISDLESAVTANTAKVTNATHTGDVTGATSLTIADDAVTYAKMQNVSATDRILGRDSAGAGVVEEITPASMRSMLNVADGAEVNVQSDWNSSSGDSQILNKPTIPVDLTVDGAGTVHANNYTNTTYSEATGSSAGLMSTAHHDKLDGIEASADVTDTANVTAAGALMDSEVTNLAQVKSFDSSDYATAAQGALADSAQQPPSEGAFANGDKTKLDGIAASADVNRTMDASPTNGNTNNSVSSDGVYDALELKAPKASPSFTGNATIAGDLTVTGNTIYSGSGPRIDFASGGHYLKFWQSGSDQNFKIMVDTQDADTDAQITFSESSAIKWNIGNDGSDSHTFKISSHSGGILSTDTELSLDTSGNLTTTGDVNGASPTEMGYLSGVTSAIQTQLNSKQATLTFGIANGNSLQVDEPDGGYTASSGDIAQFTSTGIKGVDHVSAIGKDEDDMVSDSATHFPTQQSVKAYVDASSDPKHWMDWFYYAANLASQNYFYAALHNNHTGVSSTINTDLSTSGYNTTTLNNAWRMIRYARRVPYAGTITKFMAHLEASGTAADSDVEVALWKADALADDTAHSSTGNFTCDHLGTLTYDFSSSSRHMTKQTTTFNATSISEGDWLFITLRRTTSGDGSYFHCHSTVLWDGA